MITLSTEFFVVVFIGDAGGMYVFEMFVDNCEFFKIIVKPSLSSSKENPVSTIPNLILLHIRIATRPCLLGLSLPVIV